MEGHPATLSQLVLAVFYIFFSLKHDKPRSIFPGLELKMQTYLIIGVCE